MKRVIPREGEAVMVHDRYGSYPSGVMPSSGAVLAVHRDRRSKGPGHPLSRFTLGYTPTSVMRLEIGK